MHSARPIIPTLALLLAACGGGGGATTPDLPSAQWTWVDVPGTQCSDGSRTGIAVNPAPLDSNDSIVLVFLNGGGACWESPGFFSCQYGTATAGPYQKAQFQQDLAGLPGSILDRAVAGTPFAGATLVFVPYCTGDVHWGDATRDYPGIGTWHHAGKVNLEKDIAWLEKNLPAALRAPAKVVVAGSSAGGYGSLLAFDLARTAWPDAKGYLIDDAGPPLVGSDLSPTEVAAWYSSWNLAATVDPLCGAGVDCQSDLSRAVGALRARYPDDRFALLSTLQDATMSFFLGYATGDDYQAALLRLVDQDFSVSATGTHAFLVPGNGHTLLGDAAAHSASETPLPDWIRQMVQDEPGWTTLGRPPP